MEQARAAQFRATGLTKTPRKADMADEYDQDEQMALKDMPEGLEEAIAAEVRDAVDYMDESVSRIQAEMTEFYKGELPGITQEDLDDNRSDIVSRDVHDAVQATMPDLIRTFTGHDHVVEFRPNGPDDEAVAAQATDAIRYIFEQENDAYTFIHGSLKDGLIRKYAVATWWHEVEDKSYEKEYTGLSMEDLTILLNEPGAQPIEVEEVPSQDAQEPTGDPLVDAVRASSYDVTMLHDRREHCFRVELMPPEELIVARKARNTRGDRLIGRRQNLTVDELVAMGYDREEVEEFAGSGGDTELETNELAYERNPEGQNFGPARADDGAKEVLYVEAYLRWSIDDKMQLIKVCCVGSAHKVVKWEKVDCVPMALWTPDPEPHTVIGESQAEKVADIQRLKTGVWRGMLDSLAEALVPRTEVVEGQVNLEDAMSTEIGGLVRVRAPGMVRALSTPFLGQQAFPLLELADNMREDRVGAFRSADGLSAETMQSSTKMAVAATISGSKAQKELLARGYAATFLKPIFKGLLKLFVENQDKPKTLRLRGEWVDVDPRGWNASMDAEVDVSLAMSTNEERLQVLGAVAEKQESILQQLGPQNPIVGLDQYAYTLRKMVELGGYKTADPFFKRVDPNWQPPQAAEPPPDPAVMLAQAQIAAMQEENARKAQEAQAKMALEAQRLKMDDDFRRDELAQDGALKRAEIEAKFQVDLSAAQARIDAEITMNRDTLAAQPPVPPGAPTEGAPAL
jgi:hypothetical protein